MAPSTSAVVLKGLDGANPLAFLAALGCFRGLCLVWEPAGVTLSWQQDGGWRPVICRDGQEITRTDVMQALDSFLSRRLGHEALAIGDDLKINPDDYAKAVRTLTAALSPDPIARQATEFLAAFGTEVFSEQGSIHDTAFRTMSGAGHQHFLKSMRQLAEQTTIEEVERSLFAPWTRSDPGPTMRWDPQDDRRYALRWREPSSDPIRTERGANRLAFEALPFFPTIPVASAGATVGFSGRRSRDTFWTWPIWETPAELDTVRSLLGHRLLSTEEIDRASLDRIGIVEVFRAQRLTVGKYRNFTPAKAV